MTLGELLVELGARNVQLRRSGTDVLLRADQTRLDESLLTELRTHKQDLLGLIASDGDTWWTPSARITPEMLPLVQLTTDDIDRIVAGVDGGAANVQDIYPLAPLQEGILFHSLMGRDGDLYLAGIVLSFDTRARLDAYLAALQAVIDRHDILRTSVMWEGLPEPVQVVWRRAPLLVEDAQLDGTTGDLATQLYDRYHHSRFRIDLRRAPLMRAYVAYDHVQDRWLMMRLLHHVVADHTTMEVMQEEIQAHLLGHAHTLPPPLPFGNLVAQARLGVSREDHEEYFRALLADVDEPTAPFGLLDVQSDGTAIHEVRARVDAA